MRSFPVSARAALVLTVLAVAIGLTIALTRGGPGAKAADPAEHLQPVSFEGHLGRATRRRLPAVFTTGVCGDALRFSVLRQGRHSVAIRFDEVFRGNTDRVCPAIAAYRCFTIVLRAPLAGRRVIDAARGGTIPRAGARHPAGNQTSCPRVADPPADLPPSRLGSRP
jgi:hypothetical protein